VASTSQGPDNTVQATPIEIIQEFPPEPRVVTRAPEARPKLIQRPNDDGPVKISLGEYLSARINFGEYLSSLWPAPVPFHRNCGEHCWVSADYIQGWMRPGPLTAPLASTGLASDSPNAAAIGQPGTTVLFGNSINFRTTPGARLEFGGFVDDDNRVSFEVSGLYYAPTTSRFSASSDAGGNPLLGRPFFDTLSQSEKAELDSLPGQYSGSVTVAAVSQLWGFEANARYHIYALGRAHLDFLGGYRYLRLTESLSVQDQVTGLGPNSLTLQGMPLPLGTTLTDHDSFATTNQFSGLNVGTRLRWEGDHYFVSAFGKAAFGCTNQTVQINGITSALTPGGGTTTAQGGILALPSNIGDYSRNVFAIVPECGVNLGVDLTSHIRITAGYSFLYWSEVARPGAQIDHASNPALIPGDPNFGALGGGARPAFSFNNSPFWVHSLTCGLEFHY
jgi:hypothetical protein